MGDRRATNAQGFFTLLRTIVFLCAALIVFQINGINMGSLVTSVGLVTAAVAFAVQDTLRDFIMGYNIISNELFAVGDVVKYGEVFGIVRSFNMRVTKIYDLNSGNLFAVCNRNITEIEQVSDWLAVEVPAPYGENPEKIRAVCRELCREAETLPGVTSCEFLGTDAFKGSYIAYKIFLHCPPETCNATRRKVMGLMQDLYKRYQITVPYPQMDVHIDHIQASEDWRDLVRAEDRKEEESALALEQKHFSKGQVIFKEGDWEMCMYDVLSGKVSIWSDYGKPSQRQLTVLGPGRYFGEMGVIESMPRSATAVAEEDTSLQLITGRDMGTWFQQSPDRVVGIMRQLSERTRELTADYMEVCHTVADLQEVEDTGAEKSAGLVERVRRFAAIWRKNGRS